MMRRNLGTPDRLIRLTFAILLFAAAWWWQSWVLLAASLFTFYEAAASWCVLYALLGKSSCPISAGAQATSAKKFTSSTVTVNGQQIYYEVHGEGEPLVLIQGFTCNCLVWSLVLRELAARYKVILLDNRGAGRSSDPTHDYTVENMADDVAALIDFLKIERYNVLGHSMGGAIAQTLAYKYPNKILKLILSCTSSHFGPKCIEVERFVLQLIALGASRDIQVDYIIPWVYSNEIISDEQAMKTIKQTVVNEPYAQSENGFRRQFYALEKFDSRPWIKTIKAPTLVLYGTEDILCLNDHQYMLDRIEGSERFPFENVGHLPHIEQPRKFISAVTNFL